MKKSNITMVVLVALLIGAGFYFEDTILTTYNRFNKNLQNFQKTDLGTLINEVKKEIFSPTPLNIGGRENNAVFTRAKIIAQTNFQRYDNGNLLPLFESPKLDAAAKAKADDMFKNQYFEHISPSGVDPGELVKTFGYDYIVTGENLILGNFKDETEIVQDWMNSPGHRANILNNRYSEIGVAITKGTYKGETVWIGVQEFGLPLSSCSQPDSGLKNQIDINRSRLDSLALRIDQKKDEINNTNQRSAQYNGLVDVYNALVKEYNDLNGETKNLIVQYNNQVNNFNQCVAVGK